ncbi:hypothetical protein BGZ65_007603 [Modicella reniformis]|uniref:Mannosyltransferase n=1 Tax=Modicella reniformis TaxID=1440133 RepID=A0A9P6LT21_9FUNG|nr:hypothetical protein BGZ65_007603 [Modicella reniformis]
MSSSYVTLTYHTHPFSNSVETAILALCAVLLGRIIRDHDASLGTYSNSETSAAGAEGEPAAEAKSLASITGPETSSAGLSFMLGVLFAVGMFTRITFVLYGFPLGIMFLHLNMMASFRKDASLLKGFGQFIMACIPLALGLGLTSALVILIDSIYFGKLIILDKTTGSPLTTPLQLLATTSPQDWINNLTYKGSLTVTMLNNLRYNLDAKNLAEHGLHPRYLHLLVNYPVLFGNLAWTGMTAILQKLISRQWKSKSKLVTALGYSGICGIILLSAMPHQEARFLSPLVLPLVVTLSRRISKLGRKFWPIWLLTNAVMSIVFGFLHQSGLVPAMDLVQHKALGFHSCQQVVQSKVDHALCFTDPSRRGAMHIQDDGMSYSTRVVFYKTYLPPQHLLGYNSHSAQAHGVNLTIADWRTKDQDVLLKDLNSITVERGASVDMTLLRNLSEQEKEGQQAVLFRKTGPRQFERTLLIAPATIDFSDQYFYETRDRIPWHADLDRIQVILKNPLQTLYLNVFYL